MALSELRTLSEQKVQAVFNDFRCVKSRFERLAVRILNGGAAFFELKPKLASMVIYVFCTGMGCTMFIVMGFLDMAAGTHILNPVMRGFNRHVLFVLQILNGLLALLFGFSALLGILNIGKMHALPRRSKMIKTLPKRWYGIRAR